MLKFSQGRKWRQFLRRKLTKAAMISNWLNCLRITSNALFLFCFCFLFLFFVLFGFFLFLFFCQRLISPKDAKVRRKVLNKLESEPNLTLRHLAEDCQRYVYIKKKKESKDIEESGIRKVHYTKKKCGHLPPNEANLKELRALPRNKISCSQVPVWDVGHYIGLLTATTGNRSILIVTEWVTSLPTVERKPVAVMLKRPNGTSKTRHQKVCTSTDTWKKSKSPIWFW